VLASRAPELHGIGGDDVKTLARGLALVALLVMPAAAQETLTGYTGDVKLQGSISGASTATIRAYVNGLRVAESESGAAGGYEITLTLDGTLDETAVIWLVPDDSTKVAEIIVLKESSAARRNGVWSPCLRRLKPADVLVHDVTFVTQKDLFASLEESDCWEH
jgi:hypothetical protein